MTHPNITVEWDYKRADGKIVSREPITKFCPRCGTELVVGPIIHECTTMNLDAEGHDLSTHCTCGWHKDSIWHVSEPAPRSRAKAEVAIKEHLAEAPDALRCPNEERAG